MASLHDVRIADAGAELAPGHLADSEHLTAIARQLLESSAGGCAYLPGRVLGHGIARTVWWRPAGVRAMHFAGAALQAMTGMSGRPAPHPPLVFASAGRSLSVFALEADTRPAPDTPLRRAPYTNLYRGGSVCLGSARVPERHGPDTIEAWERGWDESAFSHLNPADGAAVRGRGGLLKLWRDLIRAGAETFPTDVLAPAGITLADLLEGRTEARA